MKTFLILFNICAALLIGTVVSAHYDVNPVYPAAVVFALGLGASFSQKAKQGVAYGLTQANIFDPSQLQIKDIIAAAIYQHYGYTQTPGGQWGPKNSKSARDIPPLLDALRITRKDIFHIQYLTPAVDQSKAFFTAAQSSEFFSNFKEASLPANKMFIIAGIQAELATGAAAADTPDILDFKTPVAGTDEEVLNGLVFWTINTQKEIDGVPYKSLFVNDDGIKNFLRLPRMVVWEPNNQMDFTVKLCKAYAAATHKFIKISLMGYELTR